MTPRAVADRIEGAEIRDDGNTVLRVRVKAAPDKGKANAAVIAILAKALGVSRSAVAITSGETSRHKTVAISGDVAAIVAQLSPLVRT